jgi:hypothetical protein
MDAENANPGRGSPKLQMSQDACVTCAMMQKHLYGPPTRIEWGREYPDLQ